MKLLALKYNLAPPQFLRIFSILDNGVLMDSLKKFTDKVQKFYELVELHESVIQNYIKETKKPVHSIINQSVFYRAAAPIDSLTNTPFERLEGFREDLLENILASLQEEYNLLDKIRSNISQANEKLQKEQILLESSYLNLRSKNSIDVSSLNPCCPSFEHIIDWCHDIWCYYHSYYLQIYHALSKLNFEDETTVNALQKAVKEDSEQKNHINRIRSYKLSQFEFII